MMNQRTASIHIVFASTDIEAAERLSAELHTLELSAWIHRHELSASSPHSMLDVLRDIPSASYLLFLISRHSLKHAGDSAAWNSAASTKAILILPLLVDLIETDALPLELRERAVFDRHFLSSVQFRVASARPDSVAPIESREGTSIVALLRGELEPALPVDSMRAGRSLLQGISRRHLRLIAMHCIDDLAFQSFLFDAEIPSHELGGQTLHERLVLLLTRLDSIGVIEQFADWLDRERKSCVAAQLEQLGREEIWQLPLMSKSAERESDASSSKRDGSPDTAEHEMQRSASASSRPGSPVSPPVSTKSGSRAKWWGLSAAACCAALGIKLLVGRQVAVSELPVEERTNPSVRAVSRALKPLLPIPANDQLIPEGKHYAVLFASMIYDDPRWPRLTTPANDVHDIGEELKQLYGFQVERVDNATVTDIRRKIRELAERKYAAGDHLMLMFAGHGDKDDTLRKGWIIARDSKTDEHQSAYPYSELREDIDNIPCNHILLVLDVCFGGTFDPSIRDAASRKKEYQEASTPEYIGRKLRYRSRLYLTSVDQKTEAPEGRGHSPFAWKFLEALRSGGGPDGVLNWNELLGFLDKLNPEPRGGIFPKTTNSDPGGDFLFLVKDRGRTSPPSPGVPIRAD